MTLLRFAPISPFDDEGNLVSRDYRVVAVGENGIESVTSDVVTLSTPPDTLPPPKPSMPFVEALYGTFTVRWNFLGELNETMPHDFLYASVEMAEAPEGPWVSYGNLTEPGSAVTITGFSDATFTRWFRLVAYDQMLNDSIPSNSAQATVIPLVELPSMIDTLTDIDTRFDGIITDAGNLQTVLDQAQLDITANAGQITTLKDTTIPAIDTRLTAASNWIAGTGSELSSRLSTAEGTLSTSVTRLDNAEINVNTALTGTVDATRLRVGVGAFDTLFAEKMAASTAAFQTADIKNLFVSNGTFGSAVIDKLWADVIRARKITTDMMLVGQGENLVPWNIEPVSGKGMDNVLRYGGSGPDPTWGGTDSITPGSGNLIMDAFWVSPGVDGYTWRIMKNPSKSPWTSQGFEVEPGKEYLASIYYKAGGTYPDGNPLVRLAIVWYSGEGAYISGSLSPQVPLSFAWVKHELSAVAPATAAYAHIFVRQNNRGNVRVDRPSFYQKTDASLIVDGGILARHITASEEMSAKVGTFLTLGVDKLTAGTGVMAQATIDKLWADVVNAKKITASMLAIGSFDNMIVDPDFRDPILTASRLANSTGSYTLKVSTADSRNYIEMPVSTAQQAFKLNASTNILGLDTASSVEPGAVYRIRYQANTVGSGNTAGTRPAVRWYNSAGTSSYVAADQGGYTVVGTAWTWIDYTFTIPMNAVAIQVDIQREPNRTGVLNFKTPAVTRMNAGELVVDGSIAANHVKAKTLTVNELAANAVEASIIKVGALDGKVLTGSTIQTTVTANRGVKFDSSGIRAWDNLGRQTLNIESATGNLSFYGAFLSGAENEARVVIEPRWQQGSTPPNVGLLFQSKGYDITGRHAGVYMRNQPVATYNVSDNLTTTSPQGAMVVHSAKPAGMNDDETPNYTSLLELNPDSFLLVNMAGGEYEKRRGLTRIEGTTNGSVIATSMNPTSGDIRSQMYLDERVVLRAYYPGNTSWNSAAEIYMNSTSFTLTSRPQTGTTASSITLRPEGWINIEAPTGTTLDYWGSSTSNYSARFNVNTVWLETSGYMRFVANNIGLDSAGKLVLGDSASYNATFSSYEWTFKKGTALDSGYIKAVTLYLDAPTLYASSTYVAGSDRSIMTLKDHKAQLTPKPLGTGFLPDTTGVYYQTNNAEALLIRGYPVELAGLLEVWEVANFVYQRYSTYGTAQGLYTRTKYNTSWSDWKAH